MSSISETERRLNQEAVAVAEDACAADAGRRLCRQLDIKWYEQGRMAAQFGLPADDPGLFSPMHRRGYREFLAGVVPTFVNVNGLPALARALAVLVLVITVALANFVPAQAGGSGITPPVLRVKRCTMVHAVRTCTWVVVRVGAR